MKGHKKHLKLNNNRQQLVILNKAKKLCSFQCRTANISLLLPSFMYVCFMYFQEGKLPLRFPI